MDDNDLVDILDTLQQSDANNTAFAESWTQGRSAYGGLAAAFTVTAMRKLLTRPQPLRSLMVSFIAPVPPGDVHVDARLQRQGKNVTQAAADLVVDDAVVLQAMGVFGSPREALQVPADKRTELPPRQQGIAFSDNERRLPAFLQYFEGAWVGGGVPFGGRLDRHLQMWVKHKSDLSAFPAEKLVGIADMPPPVVLTAFSEPPVPASSLTWSLEFVLPAEQIECDWFFLDFTLEAAADGYTQQSGRIYTESGDLCALSRQCMVYFG